MSRERAGQDLEGSISQKHSNEWQWPKDVAYRQAQLALHASSSSAPLNNMPQKSDFIGTIPSGKDHFFVSDSRNDSLTSKVHNLGFHAKSGGNNGYISGADTQSVRLSEIEDELAVETKIRDGALNILNLLDQEWPDYDLQDAQENETFQDGFGLDAKERSDMRRQIRREYESADQKIHALAKEGSSLVRDRIYDNAHSKASDFWHDSGSVPSALMSSDVESAGDSSAVRHYESEIEDLDDGSEYIIDWNQDPAQILAEIIQILEVDDGKTSNSNRSLNALSALDQFLAESSSLSESDLRWILKAIVPKLADRVKRNSTSLIRSEIRAAVYRVLKTIVDFSTEAAKAFGDAKIDLYISKSLSLPKRFDREKEAALRLIRSAALNSSNHPLNWIGEGVMRVLVAIADDSEERLQRIAILTTLELLVVNPNLGCASGALRLALAVMTEGPIEFARISAKCLTFLLDRGESRHLLCQNMDIEQIFSIFTTAAAEDSMPRSRLQLGSVVVKDLLFTMSGHLFLASSEAQGLPSLCQALKIPSKWNRHFLLEIFEDIFGLNDEVFKSVGRQSSPVPSDYGPRETMRALILLNILDCGLLDSLIYVITSSPKPDPSIGGRATRLLVFLLLQSHLLLKRPPHSTAQALSVLISMATSFSDPEKRNIAIDALNRLDELRGNFLSAHGLARIKVERSISSLTLINRIHATSMTDDVDGLSESSQSVSTQTAPSGQYEDVHFRSLILESQILHLKDPFKWNLDIVMELLDGPLYSPKRIEEAMKGTRFIKRLINFFRPSHGFYASIEKSAKDNAQWIDMGSALFTTLAATPEGRRYLSESRLLDEIAFAMTNASMKTFSKESMNLTIAGGYFVMLGRLGRCDDGIALLQACGVFSAFYSVLDLPGRADMASALLTNLDVNQEGYPRLLFRKAACRPDSQTRLAAIESLTVALKDCKECLWIIEILAEAMLDDRIEIQAAAASALRSNAEATDDLEPLLGSQLVLDHTEDICYPLLMLLIRTEPGLKYLTDIGFTHAELHNFTKVQASINARQRETRLYLDIVGSSDLASSPTKGYRDLDFVSSLCSTIAGCQIFDTDGPLRRYFEVIRLATERRKRMQEYYREMQHDLSSVLWALGSIGSSESGFEMLDAEGMIEAVVQIAGTHDVLSIRGICIYAIGRMSMSAVGIARLEELDWQSTMDPIKGSWGICLPKHLSQVCNFHSKKKVDMPILAAQRSRKAWPDTYIQVLENIADLNNHILAPKASRTFVRLRNEFADLFRQVDLYALVIGLLDHSPFRLSVRRYVLDAFDVPLDSATVDRIASISSAQEETRDEQSEMSPKFAQTYESHSLQPTLPGSVSEKSFGGDVHHTRSPIDQCDAHCASPAYRVLGFCI